MVESISSYSTYQYQTKINSGSKLSDEQKQEISDIISKYDPSNMSKEDVKSMFDEIKALGIGQSDEVKSILDEAGFKPPEKPQGPPPSENSKTQNEPQYVLDFLDKLNSGSVSETDLNTLVQNLQSSGLLTQGALIDKTA